MNNNLDIIKHKKTNKRQHTDSMVDQLELSLHFKFLLLFQKLVKKAHCVVVMNQFQDQWVHSQ